MKQNPFLEFLRRRCGYRFPRLGRAVYDMVFRLSPKRVRTELFPGITVNLDLDDEVQRATYWQGERFEKPTFEVLRRWAEAGATHFFDVGSNYGFFSVALLSRHPELNVNAFEPNPATFSHLAEIKAENRIDRLAIWNLGLGERCETLSLRRGSSDSGHSTFGEHPELSSEGTDLVEVLDFETWRQRAGLPLSEARQWIAKIDVEGFEMKVLRGLRGALESRAFRGLAVEVNAFTLEFCGSHPDEIYSYMDALGYQGLTKKHGPGREEFTGNEFFVPR